MFLSGELGSGKTTLVQAIVRSLGGQDEVTSPTFDLIHIYHTASLEVLHVDGYRLTTAEEWDVLDLPMPLAPNQILLAEWADPVKEWYSDRLEVNWSPRDGSPGRRLSMMPYGEMWPARLRTVAGEMSGGF